MNRDEAKAKLDTVIKKAAFTLISQYRLQKYYTINE